MRQRLKAWRLSALAAVCALLLGGCTLGSPVEELFVLPQLPVEYMGLSRALENMLDAGYEYLYPETGPNVEAVQMVDLDGSGSRSAVVFMRRTGDANPLKIFVLAPEGDDYRTLCAIETRAAGVESVYYRDLNGDGAAELIVGWHSAGDERTVSVYRIGRECLTLMSSPYIRYAVDDLDADGVLELLVVRGGDEDSAAEVYHWETGVLLPSEAVAVSSAAEDLRRGSVTVGCLSDGSPAAFITGVGRDDMAVTDILRYDGAAAPENVTLSAETGRSELRYPYCGLVPQDVNGDGVTEVPGSVTVAEAAALFPGDGALVGWDQYSGAGASQRAAVIYHDLSGGWMLTMPENWWDRVTVAESQIVNGEKCVAILVDQQETAAIYAITSDNRESRAQISGRFIITRLPGAIYAGELYDRAELFGVDEEALRQRFALLVSTWAPTERSS